MLVTCSCPSGSRWYTRSFTGSLGVNSRIKDTLTELWLWFYSLKNNERVLLNSPFASASVAMWTTHERVFLCKRHQQQNSLRSNVAAAISWIIHLCLFSFSLALWSLCVCFNVVFPCLWRAEHHSSHRKFSQISSSFFLSTTFTFLSSFFYSFDWHRPEIGHSDLFSQSDL